MKNRKSYTPEFKAKVVIELLREEKTVNQIASEYGVHPQMLSRWKAEALERLPEIFRRGQTEAEKLKKEYEAEKEALVKQIGELTVDLNFLKKKWNQALTLQKRKH